MTKAESDLGAILDLVFEWTQENGADFTLINAAADGSGVAHATINGEAWCSVYKRDEPAGDNRTRSGGGMIHE